MVTLDIKFLLGGFLHTGSVGVYLVGMIYIVGFT